MLIKATSVENPRVDSVQTCLEHLQAAGVMTASFPPTKSEPPGAIAAPNPSVHRL